ncbi:MAG: sulfotransferase, partial [Desulfobacterales bacterium]|nr:sulfotransferase [Desulfobacterales bacterium]
MPESATQTTYSDPVFIVGMPRSGTTLLQGILSNTGKYFPMPETHFFSRVTYGLPENGLSRKDRRIIRRMLQRKARIELAPKALQHLNSQKDIFEYVIGLYNPDKKDTFLEKTPRHVFFFAKIRNYYPTARFICMTREPKNIVSSRLRKDPARKKSVIRLALLYNKIAAAICKIQSEDNVLLVRYEDLTSANESTLKKTCEFLNIAYDRRFLKNVVAPQQIVAEHEFWKDNNLVLETIRENNPDKWRHTLDIDQAHLVNCITGSYATKFGYAVPYEWARVCKGFGRDVLRLH